MRTYMLMFKLIFDAEMRCYNGWIIWNAKMMDLSPCSLCSAPKAILKRGSSVFSLTLILRFLNSLCIISQVTWGHQLRKSAKITYFGALHLIALFWILNNISPMQTSTSNTIWTREHQQQVWRVRIYCSHALGSGHSIMIEQTNTKVSRYQYWANSWWSLPSCCCGFP